MASPHRDPLTAPDPFVYRSIWGIRVKNRRGFDLLVARQMIWLPHARPAVRALLFTADEQPICPVCSELVTTGSASVVCMALLADAELQQALIRDPTLVVSRAPDGFEAWWLVHGDCLDTLTGPRVRGLDEKIELALRMATRLN